MLSEKDQKIVGDCVFVLLCFILAGVLVFGVKIWIDGRRK